MSDYLSKRVGEMKSVLEAKYILGHGELIDALIIAYFSRGHVLIEGPPGTAKTLTAKLMAHFLSKSFKRIQFTTDMLPGDILGAHIFSPKSQEFQFIQGPVFCDFVVADEINRTPPRTQSALLEAMEERQVSIEGKQYKLSEDFFVVATQNPQDYEGTFALPEVQLDRFLFKLIVRHVSADIEVQLLKRVLAGELPPELTSITPLDVDRAKTDAEIESVKVDESILRYATELIEQTRRHPMLLSGSSFRGGIALVKSARILALIQSRDFVTPDDIKALAVRTLRHRVRLNPEAQISSITEDQVIEEILKQVPFPK